MKNLLIVSVVVGSLSASPSLAKAQKSVNSFKSIDAIAPSKAVKFIEGIEINRDVPTIKEATSAVGETKKNVTIPAISEVKSAIENCSPLQFKYAQLMDVDVESLNNIDLLNFIDEWWATRYRYGGTTKKGIDCSALTGALHKNVFGTVLPRTAREQYKICTKVTRENLQQGDLVFFNTTGGISHVGVYLGNNHFLHSSCHSGVTISSLDDNYYSRKYIGGGTPNVVTEASITE